MIVANPMKYLFSRRTLAWQSLRHHWRAQLPTAAGIGLAAAVLTGALLVGVAVRSALARFARERLGAVEWAVELPTGRRVADSLAGRIGGGSVLTLPAMAIADADGGGDAVQVNHARVLGVDAAAWRLIAGEDASMPATDEVLLSARLAGTLGVAAGDSVSLRVPTWSTLPRDAPLAARSEAPTVRWRARVRAVLPDDGGGRFGLAATQVAPLNAVVALNVLQAKSGWDGRANLMVFDRDPGPTLVEAWTLADLGVRVAESNGVGLVTGDTVFLDERVASALPAEAALCLTYLVDAIENADGSRRTPYSFVMGLTPQDDARLGVVNDGRAGIVVNAWLAEQLGVAVGDEVVVRYRRWGASGGAVAESRRCRVARVASMLEAAVERAWMPAFPGLTDVERCAEWDVGMDMDPDDLADASNEAYWNTYGPTPKAFLPLTDVQAMVGPRFGIAMDARVALGPGGVATHGAALLAALRQSLDPATVGLATQPVRELAGRAARGATDFAGLFLGLSFFLIAAALLLAALLCTLGVLRRAEELGVLRAVGFGERTIFGVVFGEVLGVAALASVVGAGSGAIYAWMLLWALAQGWSGALADAAPVFVASSAAMAQGALAAWVVAGLSLAGSVRRALRAPVAGQLGGEERSQVATGSHGRGAWRRVLARLGMGSGVVGGALMAAAGPVGAMLGGAILLGTAILAFRAWARRRSGDATVLARTLAEVGRRGAALRPGREVAVMAVLSCGVFMVCAVTAMRQDVARNAGSRDAATGGFELLAELAVPATDKDLPTVDGMAITPLRVLPGEDAGCLNLNAVVTPRVIGVPTKRFAELGVFGRADAWMDLDAKLPDGCFPAWTGDRDTAQWGLKAKLGAEDGTVLTYRSEADVHWPLRLVGAPPLRMTIFQGAVLVSSERLAEAFPSLGGVSLLLVDIEGGDGDAVAAMQMRLARHGADVERTVDRLRAHYRVEATYLDMFLVLGGLGLLVATVGVGLVVLRNAEERRRETAILAAIGVRRFDRARLLWSSVAPAQVAGLAAGVAAAGVALWPALREAGTGVPWATVLGLVILVGVSGAVWSLVLAWSAAGSSGSSPHNM